jgi:antitoxin FitA
MATITIHNFPEEIHLALKQTAAINGTSVEAEISAILEDAVRPESRIRVGSEMASSAGSSAESIFKSHDIHQPTAS